MRKILTLRTSHRWRQRQEKLKEWEWEGDTERTWVPLTQLFALFHVFNQVHLQSFLFGLVCQRLNSPKIRKRDRNGYNNNTIQGIVLFVLSGTYGLREGTSWTLWLRCLSVSHMD